MRRIYVLFIRHVAAREAALVSYRVSNGLDNFHFKENNDP